MPRVAGVDIPDGKPIRIGLRYIHGLGHHHAERVVEQAGLDGHTRAHQLSEDDLARLGSIIDDNYLVEGSLRRQVNQNIARLRDIRCYRGERHHQGLPAHGQRTQTNARTRKGRRRTVTGKQSIKGQRK